MKKIMVCCGSSMITSTMAINKLKQAMQDEELMQNLFSVNLQKFREK